LKDTLNAESEVVLAGSALACVEAPHPHTIRVAIELASPVDQIGRFMFGPKEGRIVASYNCTLRAKKDHATPLARAHATSKFDSALNLR
jgi:hypothetical protein